MRKLLRAVAVLVLGAAGLFGMVGVASAGQGPSQACSDGVGAHEIPLLYSPVTLGIELYKSPTTTNDQMFLLCYSTTSYGAPGGVVGGWIVLRYDVEGTLTAPVASVSLSCAPDANVVLSCGPATLASLTLADVPQVSAPPTGICLADVNGTCRVFAPGLKVTSGSTTPLLKVTILGTTLPVDLPTHCVAVVVSCP